MSVFVIWVDREIAKLFEFSNDKMERKTLHARHTDHHTHRPDSIDQANQQKPFFHELATHLADAGRLLILGPGVAKYHFRTYIVEHVPALAKKLVGCETVDHPTDGQIADFARRFFQMSGFSNSGTSDSSAGSSEGRS